MFMLLQHFNCIHNNRLNQNVLIWGKMVQIFCTMCSPKFVKSLCKSASQLIFHIRKLQEVQHSLHLTNQISLQVFKSHHQNRPAFTVQNPVGEILLPNLACDKLIPFSVLSCKRFENDTFTVDHTPYTTSSLCTNTGKKNALTHLNHN